jgi:predicted nucleic acid-binding protein
VIVVDASAVLEVLLRTAYCEACEARLFDAREALCAPHLIDLEIAQVLGRYVLRSAITNERASQALDDFTDWQIVRYEHAVLLPRIWELRHNLTAYDAAYVALAEACEAPLVTCDERIGNSHGHRASVEVIGPPRFTNGR